jgi:putative redox protein
VDDIAAAVKALREAYRAPALLIGHSLGGTAVLAAAGQIPEAVGVATIGAPFEPKHVARLFEASLDEIESNGQADVNLGGRPFTIRKSFLEDLQKHCNAEQIGKLKKALVVFHSPQDNLVSIDNAGLIFKAARHPKSFVSLDGADHFLGRPSDSRYVADVLAAWASRYLPEQPAAEIPEDTREGEVVVEGKTTGFLQRIQARHLTFAADEPLDKGGTNLAPNPYELLLAGLGACTSMTLRMYAGRKEWPLEAVRVTLRHDRIHAKDCEDCDKDDGVIDVIDEKLELEGDLSEEQRERLLDIAAKCPVHRTLLNEIKIRSELV